MKKSTLFIGLACVLSFFGSLTVSAQKFAYVDSKYILSHMPEYLAAQREINDLSSEWQSQVEQKYATIDQLEKAYQAEKVLLTEEMRKKREEDIAARKQEAMEFQRGKFGVEGELFKKREELVAPIQEQIYSAIEELASQSQYMVVFDKSNHSNMLYSNPKFDISDKVLKKMGLKPGEILDGKGEGEEEKTGGDKKEQPKPGNTSGRGK
jgi:outer membrane protein